MPTMREPETERGAVSNEVRSGNRTAPITEVAEVRMGSNMRDTLGFTKCDSQTIARLAQAVERSLNSTVRGHTPESELVNRNNYREYMLGLNASGVPLNIITGVAESCNGHLDLDAITLITRIAIRFGMQLQRAVEANTAPPMRPRFTDF
jgi:hypothetical protein